MKPIIIALIAFWVAAPLTADDQVDKIYARFARGEIKPAGEQYRRLPPSATRDGNRLFISALFEVDGSAARNLLKTAIKSDLDGKYIEEAHFRLIQLAEAAGDTADVLTRGSVFLDKWEASPYRHQLIALMAAHSGKGSDQQERYLDLLIGESPGSFFGQGARLVKANAAFGKGHYKTAATLCRRINNSPGDDLTPVSLIMLSRIALRKNEAERALLNYNILREQYRHAIGQDELLAALKGVSEKQSGRESTEVFEGITYSVQVGVFAVRDNANEMSKRIKAYGYKAKIRKKVISGKTYYVVLAGRFNTLHEAQTAREKLELGENDVFKVVVNDEK